MNLTSFFSNPDAIKMFNRVINSTSKTLSCGPGSQCEQNNNINNLEQKYIAAQNNLKTAPEQLFESERNYYLYSKGQSGYNQYINDKYTKEANSVVETLLSNFNSNILKITQMNDTLKSLTVNYNNELELNKDYYKKNERLRDKIQDNTTDIVTNDRKTHYEKENYDTLLGWNKFWFWIYVIAFIAFAYVIFSKSSFSLVMKLLFLAFFIIYPFVINHIVFFIIRMIAKLLTYIPKNVYLTL
jgi:hypothetical protein